MRLSKVPLAAVHHFLTKEQRARASRIIDARVRSGLTKKALARRMGLRPENIVRYEYGQYFPNVDGIRTLCLALNVSADWLIGTAKSEPVRPISPEAVKFAELVAGLSQSDRSLVLDFMDRLAAMRGKAGDWPARMQGL